MVKVGKMKGKKDASGAKTGQAMQFNHALGQHILKNPLIVQALVDKPCATQTQFLRLVLVLVT